MALATHQVQGSYGTFQSRPLHGNRGVVLKRFVVKLDMVARADKFPSLKRKSCLSVGVSPVRGCKGKSLQISAFKGSTQNDESRGRESGSKSVKLPHVSQEREGASVESAKVESSPLPYRSEADQSLAGSNLFMSWLALLRTQSKIQVVDEISEGPAPTEIVEAQKKERDEILKAVWCYFLGLDATIKIPLLIFVPWFLTVNVIYGSEVSRELTPLWIIGPLIVALYIKMLRGLWALYVFSFKQTIKVVKNFPTYYMVAYRYIFGGKLMEVFAAYLWKPVVDFKNLDYRKLSKRKMKDLQVWAVEKYLDYVESIWPYYCRTIRFLKRANLI